MTYYKLFVSKAAKRPVLIFPWKWMSHCIAPFLNNVRYYRIDDELGNLVCEREIVSSSYPSLLEEGGAK